jgi:hypothetical protein
VADSSSRLASLDCGYYGISDISKENAEKGENSVVGIGCEG